MANHPNRNRLHWQETEPVARPGYVLWAGNDTVLEHYALAPASWDEQRVRADYFRGYDFGTLNVEARERTIENTAIYRPGVDM